MSAQNLNIVPIYMDGLDCVDNTALTICNHLRGEYVNAFWNSWNINYKPDFVIGRGLVASSERIQKNVRNQYGIDFVPQGDFDKK